MSINLAQLGPKKIKKWNILNIDCRSKNLLTTAKGMLDLHYPRYIYRQEESSNLLCLTYLPDFLCGWGKSKGSSAHHQFAN